MSEFAGIETSVVRVTFDAAEPTQPTAAIVEALSAATGTSPLDLPPLYDAVDPDALNRLFAHATRTDLGEPLSIEFTADGWGVVVSTDGEVRIIDAG